MGKLVLRRQAKRAQPEQQLHKAVAAYLRLALRPPTTWTTMPAGGGGRVRGAQLKAMGLAPGWPDMIVLHPTNYSRIDMGPPGQIIWSDLRPRASIVVGLELKTAKGRQSPEQRLMRDALMAAGARYIVCKSIDDVSLALRAMGIPLHATAWARAA